MTKYSFQAEINQLMSLIINSFYNNKDIFLRELISNASDAIDKHRHECLQSGNTPISDYTIKLSPDKEMKTLTLEDNGIGMSKEDLINNLGTIARSGTRLFMENMKDTDTMIGQFGVGFYSAFLVSDNVEVYSSKDDGCHVWKSDANGSFTIEESDAMPHGSKLVLHLKEDAHEYLSENKLKELVKKHNQFITYPIELLVTKTKEVEVAEEEIESVKDAEEEEYKDAKDEIESVEDTEEQPKKTKCVEYTDFECINKEKPIWMKNPDEVSKEEYESFYKSITNDWDSYLSVKHFSVEGQLEFTGLLYIPKRAPFDLFDETKKMNNVKLYVKRVFVTDESEHLLPEWLSFVKGIVDSNDLPLNISREYLQQNRSLKTIRKNLIKKSIELVSELEDSEFTSFYEEFSKNIKLGAYQDSQNRDKLLKLMRWPSINSDMMTFEEYIKTATDKKIYYMCGDDVNNMKNSPFVEKFKKLDMDVLFMSEPIDEYLLQQVKEYSEHKLINVTKDGLNLSETTDSCEELCKYMKECLGDKVEKVIPSTILVDSPCCLVSSEYGWSANMERIMKAQALRSQHMNSMMSSKKIMEINPEHAIIKNMKDNKSKNMVELLYDIASVGSGFTVNEPFQFSKRMYKVLETFSMDDTEIENEVVTEMETENEVEMETEDDMEEVD